MFRRTSQPLLKRAIQSFAFRTPNTLPILTNFSSQHLKTFSKVQFYSFSSSFQQNVRPNVRQTVYEEEASPLLKRDQPEQYPERVRVMEKYLQCQDLTADDILLISENFCSLAVFYCTGENQEKGLKYLKENEEFLEKAGITDTISVANNYFLQGTFFLENQDMIDTSKHLLSEAERIAKSLGDDEEAKSLVNHCRVSFARMALLEKDQDKALEQYLLVTKDADYFREGEFVSGMIHVFHEIGEIYHSRNDIEKTVEYLTKAFEISTRETGESAQQRTEMLAYQIATVLLTQSQMKVTHGQVPGIEEILGVKDEGERKC